MAASQGEVLDPKALLGTASRAGTVRLFDKGDVVFKQSDAADAVFYIGQGEIKITVSSRQGKGAVVGILEAGDFLGEGCLSLRPDDRRRETCKLAPFPDQKRTASMRSMI